MRKPDRFVVLLSAAFVLAGCSPRKAPERIWIGQLLALTGPDRLAGQQARQGALLAVEDAKSEGKTANGRPLGIRLVDERGDAAAARAETVRLTAVNRVPALLAGPEPALAGQVVQATSPYGLALVLPCEYTGPTPGQAASPPVRDAVLVLGVAPAERGRALGRYARTELKASRAAVLTDCQAPGASDLADAFARAWPEGSSVARWDCDKEAERPDVVKRALATKPAVVLLAVSPQGLEKLRTLLRSAGWKGPLLYGGPDVGAAALRRASPGDAEIVLATTYFKEGLTEEGKQFAHRYADRFGEAPELPAVQAYDGARILFEALSAAGSEQRSRVADELKKRESFTSLTGPISWERRQPRRRLFVVGLRNDGAHLLQTVAP